MPTKLESNIRQILRDIRFPMQNIRHEFCDALTFASDEADFFIRANEFLHTIQSEDLNYEFYDKAKACFGAEVIDLYFDTSLLGNESLDESFIQLHELPVASQTNPPNITTISEQLDLFTQLAELDVDKVIGDVVSNNTTIESGLDNDQSIADALNMLYDEAVNAEDIPQNIEENHQTDDIIGDNSEENDGCSVVSNDKFYPETDNLDENIIHEDWQEVLADNGQSHSETRFYEIKQQEKNSQNDAGYSELDTNGPNDFDDSYDSDDYGEIKSNYSYDDYELNENYHQNEYDNNDESDNFYEDEFDLEEKSLNIYDIEESESSNTELHDLEIPDITFSEDILGAMLNTVSTQDRITQEVVNFVLKNNLNYDEYNSVLENIFFHLGWNGAKHAIQRLFTQNSELSVDMLTAVFELKLAWEEHDAFWAARHKNGSFENNYAVLSWPVAYAVINSYHYIPDIEEVVDLLYEKYYQWRDSTILSKAFPCFMKYVWSQFFGVKGLLPETYHEDFRLNEFTPELWEDNYDISNNQIKNELVDYGVAISESFPSIEYWTLEKTWTRLAELNEKPNRFIMTNEEEDDE